MVLGEEKKNKEVDSDIRCRIRLRHNKPVWVIMSHQTNSNTISNLIIYYFPSMVKITGPTDKPVKMRENES